jgi:glycosyltransferase involved in cell wall biosynthesis
MTTRIVVNEAILARGISGSARVTRYLIDALETFEGAVVRGVRPPRERGGSKILNAWGDAHWDLRGASRAGRGADLLVSPCNIGRAMRGQAHVLMVYDVMVWEAREHFDPAFAAYARALIPPSIRSADVVLTISEHSRAALAAMAPNADVRIVHPPAPGKERGTATFPATRPTVVLLGETAPHKNQSVAIAAVRRLRDISGADVALRVIGPRGRAEQRVLDQLESLDPDRAWTRREVGLSEEELDSALDSAWLLVQPSLHEGYGLPLIEAAQRGLPVVHSGREGMADILPQSSVDSVDVDPYAARMLQLLDESAWRDSAAYGLSRSELFTTEQFRAGVLLAVSDALARRRNRL